MSAMMMLTRNSPRLKVYPGVILHTAGRRARGATQYRSVPKRDHYCCNHKTRNVKDENTPKTTTTVAALPP